MLSSYNPIHTLPPKVIANRLALLQIFFVLLTAIVFSVFDQLQGFYSALLGGFASVVPNYFFARKLMVLQGAKQIQQKFVKVFLLGELGKLLSMAILIAVCILFVPLRISAFVIGFAVTFLSFWFGPVLLKSTKGEV